jgi:hypothetical protein
VFRRGRGASQELDISRFLINQDDKEARRRETFEEVATKQRDSRRRGQVEECTGDSKPTGNKGIRTAEAPISR